MSIVDVPGLHAKVYIGKNSVVISSANASANGLGQEGDERTDGIEAGYFSGRQEDIEATRLWFEGIFKRGQPVTKKDLPELKTLWLERQANRLIRSKNKSFLEILLKYPYMLSNRRLYVAIISESKLPKDVERRYKQSIFFKGNESAPLTDYAFYWDASSWNMKTGDFVLDFIIDDDKIINFEGIFRVQAVLDDGLIPLEKIKKPFGLSLLAPDRNRLARRVLSLLANRKLQKDQQLISIDDFARAVAGDDAAHVRK